MRRDDEVRDLESSAELRACRGQLREAREELRRSREHLTSFAAQMSHDLRTPLTSILANAEMLAAEPAVAGDADVAWMVGAIERGARRMDAMIEQMLRHARDPGAPVLGEAALEEVFRAAWAELGGSPEETGAELSLQPMPTVRADGDQLRTVALALLSDAVRFSRPDVDPRVTVRAERLPGHWRVHVTDNGVGVPADRREDAFVPFRRVGEPCDGAGLGLAVARHVVEAHGGRIGLEGAAGGGTTVWFDLPV